MEDDPVAKVQDILTYVIFSLLTELRRENYVCNTFQLRRYKRTFYKDITRKTIWKIQGLSHKHSI